MKSNDTTTTKWKIIKLQDNLHPWGENIDCQQVIIFAHMFITVKTKNCKPR